MRGFTNIFRVENTPVNLSILEEFRAGSDVTVEKLMEAGVVRKRNSRVKILGDGELSKKLNVSAHAFSKSAIKKIEAAGGTVTVVAMPVIAQAPKSAKSANAGSAKQQ
jgi:large subunit ribosomal protein L15